MNRRQISVFAIFSLALIIFAPLCVKATTVQEPALVIRGTLTKDIVKLDDIFAYYDSDNNLQTLPYSYDKDSNITFDAYNIEFKNAFLNESIADATDVLTACTLDKVLLRDSNYIKYILFTLHNSTATTSYRAISKLTVDYDFNRNYYLLFIAKLIDKTADVTDYEAIIYLKVLDEGGEDHLIILDLTTNVADVTVNVIDSSYDSDTRTDDIAIYANITKYNVIQYAMSFLEDKLSVSLVKITEIWYSVLATSDQSVADSYIKIAFRVASLFNTKVMINSIVLNKTSTISINSAKITSSVDIEKIADVSIPFIHEVKPEKSFDSSSLTIKYDYLFTLKTYDGEVSYSNVVANFTIGDIPAENISYFYVNGGDYTEQLKANGYYAWDISPDTQYYVSFKASGIPEDLFDALVETEVPPSFWVNPGAWFQYYFWHIVFLVASLTFNPLF